VRFDLNLKQLKVFYYAGQHLSFTRAAEELFITQPAVTMQIRSLEEHCGLPLFVKEKNRLQLTDAGHTLFSYAEEMMRLAEAAEAALNKLLANPAGIIRLGTTKTLGRYLMAPLVYEFHERHPKVMIQLDEGCSTEMALSVAYGRNDLALVGRVPYDRRVEAVPFARQPVDPLVLAVSPDHPLAGRERVALADTLAYPMILREDGSGTRQVLMGVYARLGAAPTVLLEASNVELIKELVTRNTGISVLPSMSVAEESEQGLLRAIPLDDDELVLHIDLVFPRKPHHAPSLVLLQEFLLS
jgi:DNA-binding transcriptional LysR family regulator